MPSEDNVLAVNGNDASKARTHARLDLADALFGFRSALPGLACCAAIVYVILIGRIDRSHYNSRKQLVKIILMYKKHTVKMYHKKNQNKKPK